MYLKKLLFPLIAALALASQALAFEIVIDYGDTLFAPDNPNLFDSQAARDVVNKAAADVSALLSQTQLGAVPSTHTGSSGIIMRSGIVVWDPYVFDSDFGTPGHMPPHEVIYPHVLDANTFTIYVGAQTMTGSSASVLGMGGGVSLVYGTSSGHTPATLNPTIQNFNDVAERTPGILMGGISGINFNHDGYDGPDKYDNIYYGTLGGVIAFNNAFDWNTTLDMPESWQYDLYSVALHEILHTLGFGLTLNWDDVVDAATNWDEASGGNEGHIAIGTKSLNPYEVAQDALMTPYIGPGVRQYITELDAQIMSELSLGKLGYDIDWDAYVASVKGIPEPSTVILLFVAAPVALYAVRRARLRKAA